MGRRPPRRTRLCGIALPGLLGLLGLLTACSSSATPTSAPTNRATPTSSTAAGGHRPPGHHPATPACAVIPKTWSTSRLAAAVTTVSADDTDLTATEAAVHHGAGAVLLFGATPPANLASDLARLKASAPHGPSPIVMTDEEGGDIERVGSLVGHLPWPRTAALTLRTGEVHNAVKHVGAGLARLGITMDLAPVLDLSDGPGPDATHPDGQRSFSIHPAIAAEYGIAFAHGLMASGIIPVTKHFPGLGTANNNTDSGHAYIAPLSALEHRDLIPFQAAIKAGVPAVMVNNAVVQGGPNLPVVVRRALVTGLLRHQLGFHGLIVTDALTAGALKSAGYAPGAAAVAALRAGADLVLDGNLGATEDDVAFQATTSAIEAAVHAHTLSLARLRSAAVLVRAAQSGLACLESVSRS